MQRDFAINVLEITMFLQNIVTAKSYGARDFII